MVQKINTDLASKILLLKKQGMSIDDLNIYIKGHFNTPKTLNQDINTTKSVLTHRSIDLESSIRETVKQFKKEKLYRISIAKPYSEITGGWIKVRVNGVGLELPCNGEEYKIPESLFLAFKDRLNGLDEMNSMEGPIIKSDANSLAFQQAGLRSLLSSDSSVMSDPKNKIEI